MQCIRIALFMISIVVQCNRTKIAMHWNLIACDEHSTLAMHWNLIAYDKHSCAMHKDCIAYDKHYCAMQ